MSNETQFDFGGEIVWRPSPELISQSNLTRFKKGAVNESTPDGELFRSRSLPAPKPPKEQAEEKQPGGIHTHRVTKLVR